MRYYMFTAFFMLLAGCGGIYSRPYIVLDGVETTEPTAPPPSPLAQ